jgi:hypothetical protein
MKTPLASFLPLFVISCLLLPVTTANGQVSSVFVRDYPQTYIVQEGDSIRQIAGRFLTDPSQWSDFWLPTPFRDDDSELRAGDIVRVEFINGRARLVAQRGDVQFERLEPQMREIGVTSEIPAIPLEDIQSAFTRNRIVAQELYDSAPYIVSPMSKNLVIGTGDEVYARGDWPSEVTSFEVYREVNTFRDPEDSRNRSVELITVGTATVVGEESSNVKRLEINASASEIKVGDHLLIAEEIRFDSIIYPTEPDRDVSGRIVAMTNTERMASQLDSVLIDVGTRDGLEIGDVLAVKQAGEQVVDDTGLERKSLFGRLFATASNQTVEMPRQEVGTLLIYRVFDNLSYGVILTSSEPARLGDMVVSP